jgi:secreted PhoX family phosphatase
MIGRRRFINQGCVLASAFLGLRSFVRKANGAKALSHSTGYGALHADPDRILQLPLGFSHKVISQHGETMDDGLVVPGQHDGMGAFRGENGRIILVRNHELSPDHPKYSPFGQNFELSRKIDHTKIYDAGTSNKIAGYGGTTTVVYNPETQSVEQQFLSLAGTEWNCAGGKTPWGSWISCEETNATKGGNYAKDHGYNFDVPARADSGLTTPVPLKAMGRFRHEAIAVAARTGIIYQTEDRHDGLIYRFIPQVKNNPAAGGKLQALRIRQRRSMDTRNWTNSLPPRMPVSKWIQTRWVDIDNVESPDDSLRQQGHTKGAALFARGEGMWYGNDSIYWACTNGGPFMRGQIFRYTPSPFEGTPKELVRPGRLQLYIESHASSLIENCDNLTVAPWGDLFICEDNSGSCAMLRVTPKGEISKFALNTYSSSELAGACFSPNGKTLFVNVQKNGQTLAITGPWRGN